MSRQDKYAQIFDDLVRYVAHFDPDFPHRMKPATKEEILSLQELVAPDTLPEVYVVFLERMGGDHGGLNIAPEGTTNIRRVLQYYRRSRQNGGLVLRPGCFWIGSALQSYPIGLYTQGPLDEPKVVFIDSDGQIMGTYAESLSKLLFQTAFDKYRWREFPATGVFSGTDRQAGTENHIRKLEEISREQGFTKLWFSEPRRLCCELNGRAAISANQFEGKGISLRISGMTAVEALDLARPYQELFSLKFSKWLDVASAQKWEVEERGKSG